MPDKKPNETPRLFLSAIYVLAAVMLGSALRLAAEDGDAMLAAQFLTFGGVGLAVGIWSLPIAVDAFFTRPDSPLRRWAGTPFVFLRPLLAAVTLAAVIWVLRLEWPRASDGARFVAAIGPVVLALSTAAVFAVGKDTLTKWRTVGALVVRVTSPKVRPGEKARAAAETTRACREMTVSAVLYSSQGGEKDDEETRIAGNVASIPSDNGLFRWAMEVPIPAGAPPSLTPSDEADVDAPWRTWMLEVVALGDGGARVETSEEFEVVG